MMLAFTTPVLLDTLAPKAAVQVTGGGLVDRIPECQHQLQIVVVIGSVHAKGLRCQPFSRRPS